MTDTVINADLLEEIDLPSTAGSPTAEGSIRLRRRPFSVILAALWLTIVVVAAVTANILPLTDPSVDAKVGVRVRPFHVLSQPLGTDALGRSILSRVIFGARVSLVAGVAAVLLALVAGLLVGVSAGYIRGKYDAFVGLILDSMLAIPALVLLMALAAVLRPSLKTVIIGLALVCYPQFARLARANTLQHRRAEFVLAARGLGARPITVLFRDILPLVLISVSAYAGVICAVLILAESSLSFLGLGVPPPHPSWGNMIAEGRNNLQHDPHLVFVPVVVLFLTIFSMNHVGDWLRSRADVDSRL
jgi:peptide/nickel transport system permease protein